MGVESREEAAVLNWIESLISADVGMGHFAALLVTLVLMAAFFDLLKNLAGAKTNRAPRR